MKKNIAYGLFYVMLLAAIMFVLQVTKRPKKDGMICLREERF